MQHEWISFRTLLIIQGANLAFILLFPCLIIALAAPSPRMSLSCILLFVSNCSDWQQCCLSISDVRYTIHILEYHDKNSISQNLHIVLVQILELKMSLYTVIFIDKRVCSVVCQSCTMLYCTSLFFLLCVGGEPTHTQSTAVQCTIQHIS